MKRPLYVCLASGLSVLLCGCPRGLPPSAAVSSTTMLAVRGALAEGVSGGGEAVAETLGDPDGWATLAGRISIAGAAPINPPLTVNKDVEVCAPGGKQVLDEAVLVGPGNGLQNVLIYVASSIPTDNPAWLHDSYAAVRTAEIEFDQKNCIFLTRVGVMWSTQTLKVLNSDPVGHNTNLASKRGAKAQDILIPAGGYAMYEPGAASPTPFGVSCAIHPWMKASMMVCDHPYYAVTKADGSFEIPNLPSGVPLEFRVWQEKAGFVQAVTVDGSAAKWSKGRFTRTLANGERVELNVAIDATTFQ